MRMLVSLFVVLFLSSLAAEAKGNLEVTVTGLKVEGNLWIALYNKDDGFPVAPEKAMKKRIVKVTKSKVVTLFKNLTAGSYAVAVFHDQNANDKIDTNWIGIPVEGVGVSNKAKGFMGPPAYKDAKFSFPPSGKKIAITVSY